MPVETFTARDRRLIEEFGIRTAEEAESELQRRGISYLLEARNNLVYRHHGLNGAGWTCWVMGRGFVAGSKVAVLLHVLDARLS